MNSDEKMSVILNIAHTRGLKAKMAILGAHSEIRSVLKAALNPYWQYGITIGDTKLSRLKAGTGVFNDDTNKLLTNLMTRRITGTAAKNAVDAELERLTVLSQELLARIINKDLRCGLRATSINKVFNNLIPSFPVKLAKVYETGKMTFPCLISPKIDGLRCIYKDGILRSRYGHALIGLDHIVDLIKHNVPSICYMDGELTVPGLIFDEISGNIRSFKKSDNAVFNVFEAEVDGRTNEPQYSRVSIARLAVTTINSPSIHMVEHITVQNEEDAMAIYEQYRRVGYEGAVLKDDLALPFEGRSWAWCKLKPKDSVDLVVKAVQEGRGKYTGCCGALICDFNGVEVSVGGGLSDAQRAQWFIEPEVIEGKVVSVEYMEITKQGSLRHPRLICVRGDL